jgi:hypothetical protein
MTNDLNPNPNHYAVVWYDTDDVPKVCRGSRGGSPAPVTIDGVYYHIYPTANAAAEELVKWPTFDGRYGVVPAWTVLEEVPQPRWVLKASAKAG